MPDVSPRISGIILAAGHGERMLPLTASLPKPLIPILGTPLFGILVRKLERCGATDIHCNIHHLAGAIEGFAEANDLPVKFHRERNLLGTGGGIGNMAASVSSADIIILHNGDCISELPFEPAIDFHRRRGALVTLMLAPSGPRANVAMDADGVVESIGERAVEKMSGGSLLGYTGMAVLSPESLPFFPRGEKAHLVPILSAMIRTKRGSVVGWSASPRGARLAWGETGSPGAYLTTHRSILIDKVRFDPALEPPALPLHVGAGAVIDPEVEWRGFCELGPRSVIERGSRLENCVVLADTMVARGSAHRNEILFPGGSLKATDGS